MPRIVGLERVLDLPNAVASMVEHVKSMSGDTERIERHAAHLDLLDERLDRITALMERMVSSIDELSSTVEELRESIEPVGRLANRFPGGSKRNADRGD